MLLLGLRNVTAYSTSEDKSAEAQHAERIPDTRKRKSSPKTAFFVVDRGLATTPAHARYA